MTGSLRRSSPGHKIRKQKSRKSVRSSCFFARRPGGAEEPPENPGGTSDQRRCMAVRRRLPLTSERSRHRSAGSKPCRPGHSARSGPPAGTAGRQRWPRHPPYRRRKPRLCLRPGKTVLHAVLISIPFSSASLLFRLRAAMLPACCLIPRHDDLAVVAAGNAAPQIPGHGGGLTAVGAGEYSASRLFSVSLLCGFVRSIVK